MKRKYETGSEHLKRRPFFNVGNEMHIDVPDGDIEKGKVIYKDMCAGCHNLFMTAGSGPKLHNIYGKKAATQPGFSGYSQDLRRCGHIWSKHKLYELLYNPEQFLGELSPMQFTRITDHYERACLIEYLHYMRIHTAKTVKPEWINLPYE